MDVIVNACICTINCVRLPLAQCSSSILLLGKVIKINCQHQMSKLAGKSFKEKTKTRLYFINHLGIYEWIFSISCISCIVQLD